MPMQQANSNFAARLGARIAAAHAEHKDKPIDTGNRRLPGGIKNGIAKLSSIYTKQSDADEGVVPKGGDFLRASAVVVSPEVHDGEKVAGLVTSKIIPLCDTPAKGRRQAKSFEEHWFDVKNLFHLLGIAPPTEQGKDEAAGMRIQAYYFSAMDALTGPDKPPVYILFSTRAWTPPATAEQPKPQEMVFEEWHGLATPEDVAKLKSGDAGAGVRERQPDRNAPPPTPPTGAAAQPTRVAPPAPTTQVARGAAPPTTNGTPPQYQPDDDRPENRAELVAELVEIAMMDPDLTGVDAQQASARLEEMAWAAGWGKAQTSRAADWAAVGEMALTSPDGLPAVAAGAVTPPQPVSANGAPKVGDRFKFAKRKKDGTKLTNNKGEPFAPVEVEVVTVDAASHTCTVKTVKDGKDVVDFTTKLPTVVRWEWRE